MSLLQHYLNKGHVLYCDNWYSSPTLFNLLHQNKTGACGTVRKNRKGLPKFTGKSRKGDVQWFSSSALLAMKWKDKRDVYMLSTVNSTNFLNSGKIDRSNGTEIMKPALVMEYSQKMGAVDETDMQISFSASIRKTLKWYKKLFFHMMDMAIFNSYIAYRMKHNAKDLQLAQFKLLLVREILQRYGPSERNRVGRPSNAPTPLRLVARHFPDNVPQDPKSRERSRRNCIVCSAKQIRQRSYFMCLDCNVPLCVPNCFRIYHTKLHFDVDE